MYTSQPPRGLYYIDNIIPDENELVSNLNSDITWTHIKNNTGRVVKQYGFEYDYINRQISKPLPDKFPDYINNLSDILTNQCRQLNLISESDPTFEFNQCIVNKYACGEGISAHTDLISFGSIIGCFTIGSGASLVFKNKKTDEIFQLYTKPASCYIMSGESRYTWTHEMPSRKFDLVENDKIKRGERISITFRHVTNK